MAWSEERKERIGDDFGASGKTWHAKLRRGAYKSLNISFAFVHAPSRARQSVVEVAVYSRTKP